MTAVLLFIFYFILLLLIIKRVFKQKRIEINFRTTILIFSLKVLLGCLYGFIFLHYYGGDDTWMFYRDSVTEYQKLIRQPGVFFNDLLPDSSFWNTPFSWQNLGHYLQDLEYWLMLKLLAFFNIFSRGNYYIDVLFFDFVVLWGPVLIFKLLFSIFPHKKNTSLILSFFIPSVSFWISGIRAEGLLLLFIGLILYYSYPLSKQKRIWRICWILFGLIGFMIFRPPYLLAFLLAFLCGIICFWNPSKAVLYFVSGYGLSLFIFLGSLIISPAKNLSTPFISRQREFSMLHGNTRYKLDSLEPSMKSFGKVLPEAFANTFLRPFVWESKGLLQLLSAIEIMGFWMLMLLLIIYPEKEWKTILQHPLLLLFLFYGFSQILIIGYIVPFPGAIVRYKSIPELFLSISMAIAIDWKKMFKLK